MVLTNFFDEHLTKYAEAIVRKHRGDLNVSKERTNGCSSLLQAAVEPKLQLARLIH